MAATMKAKKGTDKSASSSRRGRPVKLAAATKPLLRSLAVAEALFGFAKAMVDERREAKKSGPALGNAVAGLSLAPETAANAILGPGKAKHVAAAAFLNAYLAWENFIEGAFLRYLAGGTAPNGWAPRLRIGRADSLTHALEVLAQRDRHIDWWNKPKDVREKAAQFFKGGEPFSHAFSDATVAVLQAATVLRNRVAHSSKDAKKAFKKTAMTIGAKKQSLPRGYMVGDLLMEPPEQGFGKRKGNSNSVFEAILEVLRKAAADIAPDTAAL